MKKFRELTEAKETVVFGFGRFNPPTTGHEKLIEKVASVAGSNPFFIYPSHTINPKRDPLPHALKTAYMRKMFKKYAKNIIADKGAKTAIEIAIKLYDKGFKNLIMVVGSDRLKEFSVLLNKYNDAPDKKGNQLFKFDSVEVISAGERDPDSEGVEGMSASKMRAVAADGDKDSFLQGVPSSFKDGDKLYRDVRKYMGIREDRDMGDMNDFETVRDMYLTGKIWNAGDIVEAHGFTGEVVRKGTNYLSFVAEDGKVHKAWLHEITLDEVKSSLQKLKDFDKSRVSKGKPPIFTDKKPPKFVRMKKSGQMTIMNVPTDDIEKFEKKGYEIIEDLVGVKPMSGPTGQIFALKSEEVDLDERNYALEYQNYGGRPEQIARRSSRNKARRAMGDKAVKGMDVGHRDNNPMNNDPSNLRNEDPSKNRREPRLREKPELEEKWYNDLVSKMSQITHPKGWHKLAKEYAAGMNTPEHRAHPSAWAQKVANNYTDIDGKSLVKYINKLIDQGKLPKELKAEVQHESFKSFVDRIQVQEVLGSGASQKDYIDDFIDSDAPQFTGKSKKERIAMAIAAFRSKNEEEDPCWKGYKQLGMKKKNGKDVPNCIPEAAEYQGREVKLNDPFRLPTGSNSKFGVYVKNDKDNVVKVTFGDPNMGINRDDPKARAAFRSRHSCDDDPGPKWKARYWSCYQWRAGAKVDN